MPREIKVGLLVLAALATLAVGVFLVGEQQNLFTRKNDYFIRFPTVVGLNTGSPVQLSGVNVGTVHDIVLPEDIEEEQLTVWVTIDARYAQRVREDSLARIKTLGLLGDKYVDITSGSPDAGEIPSGGEIPAAPATDVDRLIAQGEDVVDNVVAVAVSLRNILAQMEKGEGLLGELITDTETASGLKASARGISESLSTLLERLERGEGTMGRLLTDEELADRLEATLTQAEALLQQVESGQGMLGMLLNDPEARDSLATILREMESTSLELSATVEELGEGEGILPMLMTDEEYAAQVSEELRQLLHNLNVISEKVRTGDGTIGALINDPQVYEAVNDILVGIDESRFLRWLIRNRQKAGIQKRYRDEQEQIEAEDSETGTGY